MLLVGLGLGEGCATSSALHPFVGHRLCVSPGLAEPALPDPGLHVLLSIYELL